MKNIIQELSFNLHSFVYEMGEDEWIKELLMKFGTEIKKEYLKLLFSAHRATQLKNYESESDILTVLDVNSGIQLFLNELQRLEVKNKSNNYLTLLNDMAKT